MSCNFNLGKTPHINHISQGLPTTISHHYRTQPAGRVCNLNIKAGRGGRSSAIPLNEVIPVFRVKDGRRNESVQAAMLAGPPGKESEDQKLTAMAARCVDGNNGTGCYDGNMTANASMTLVLRLPCNGSGVDTLDKLVLVNTKCGRDHCLMGLLDCREQAPGSNLETAAACVSSHASTFRAVPAAGASSCKLYVIMPPFLLACLSWQNPSLRACQQRATVCHTDCLFPACQVEATQEPCAGADH